MKSVVKLRWSDLGFDDPVLSPVAAGAADGYGYWGELSDLGIVVFPCKST